jgi:hypothetical protein
VYLPIQGSMLRADVRPTRLPSPCCWLAPPSFSSSFSNGRRRAPCSSWWLSWAGSSLLNSLCVRAPLLLLVESTRDHQHAG